MSFARRCPFTRPDQGAGDASEAEGKQRRNQTPPERTLAGTLASSQRQKPLLQRPLERCGQPARAANSGGATLRDNANGNDH
ncbi:MAG TPA: hypothetical protein VFK05_09275, partial [Polyangiaceae bacterium]|nr:hypothetical protein [Polyangiaceae bacterium]